MKLIDLLKEIKINTPGKSILWGMDNQGRFTELVKLKGFKTPQEASDAINKVFVVPDYEEDPIENYQININNPSYAYLDGGGGIRFVKDLSEFGRGYETEEGWGITKWSTEPPS